MKKVILSALVVGSLLATSCKEAKEAGKDLKETTETVAKEGAKVVKDGAEAVADGVKEGAEAVADGAKDLAAKATETVTSAVEGVTIPEFEDPKVGEHLKSYSEYAKDYIAAGADAYKDVAIVKKGAELATQGAEIVKGLDATAKAKYDGVITALKAKMAPAK